jgi:hypothetical protein
MGAGEREEKGVREWWWRWDMGRNFYLRFWI